MGSRPGTLDPAGRGGDHHRQPGLARKPHRSYAVRVEIMRIDGIETRALGEQLGEVTVAGPQCPRASTCPGAPRLHHCARAIRATTWNLARHQVAMVLVLVLGQCVEGSQEWYG